jgi:elongation factor Ts
VARTDTFKELARDLAMHITATNPRYVDVAAIPSEELHAIKEQLRREALAEGKPETEVDQIVEGRLKKYAAEVCLLDQPWVRDPEMTIRERIQQAVATIHENIQVRRFARYQLGE